MRTGRQDVEAVDGARLPIFFEDLIAGARLLANLPFSLRRPLDHDRALDILGRRFECREDTFLALAKLAIFQHAGSPYQPLLRRAGCEYGDLERLVRQDGIEAALSVLHRQGVYLTVDEFKGRRPVVRGSVTIAADPQRLRNPATAFHVPVRTGGSRGPATAIPIDLAFVRDRAVNTLLGLDARGGARWVKAHWQVPGGGALARLLEFASFGAPPRAWFTQIDPGAPGLHPRYRWSARVMRWASLLAGVPLPRPIHAPLETPLPIARWMAKVLASRDTPHLFTFASSAVRLCQAALNAGVDLRGAQFTVTGESLTAARLAVIRRVGAEAVPRYAIMECGAIGLGCLQPERPDDVHLLHDLHAVIQPDPANDPGSGARTLFISSLTMTAPFVLLNVSMGDQAVIVSRRCGCPLERLGWSTHLHTIQSREKLTAAGMTFLDTDVVRVLEEVLPARFGGMPTDYQLVEDETVDGHPRLWLLVNPTVGRLDPDVVVRTFLAEIGAGSGVQRVMELMWRDADVLRVERRPPQATTAGKILHLHLNRNPSRASARGSG